MDEQQRRMIDGAAREFSDALVTAYETTSDGTAAQRLGAQQTEYFFNTVMDNLRTQAEGVSRVTRQLAAQQELARAAARELALVSTDNYMDFLDSAFSFYHGGTSRTRRRAEEARRRVEGAEARAEEAEKGRSEGERQIAEANKGTEEAERRAEGADKRVKSAQRRAQKAERSAREAEKRAEEAEARAVAAQDRAEEAERRAEEAERSRSEAESRTGSREGEDDTEADAGSRSQSIWVRTSGRSKTRGRGARSRRRSSGRRR